MKQKKRDRETERCRERDRQTERERIIQGKQIYIT